MGFDKLILFPLFSFFFFTLMVDVLGSLVGRAKASSLFKDFSLRNDKVEVSHLQFVADFVFFVNDEESLQVRLDFSRLFQPIMV